MKKLKIKIHPLFIIMGCILIMLNCGISFLICLITILIHEYGHFLEADKRGYLLNEITLMPYGAVIKGDGLNFSKKDEIMIALAGPIVNIFIAVILCAIAFIEPVCYNFLKEAIFVNVFIGGINLLPCYPLDGGRIAYCIMKNKMKGNSAQLLLRFLGILFSALLTVIFFLNLNEPNYSLLTFAFFIIYGSLVNLKKESVEFSLFSYLVSPKVKKGIKLKQIIIHESSTVFDAYKNIEKNCICEFVVVDDSMNRLCVISQNEILKLVLENKKDSLLISCKDCN